MLLGRYQQHFGKGKFTLSNFLKWGREESITVICHWEEGSRKSGSVCGDEDSGLSIENDREAPGNSQQAGYSH
jgi:hypothetical protein